MKKQSVQRLLLGTLWSSPILIGLLYTWLNAEKRLVVKWLGNDEAAVANANRLSWALGGVLLLSLGLICWRALSPVSRPVRTVLELLCVITGLALLREFLRWNLWL